MGITSLPLPETTRLFFSVVGPPLLLSLSLRGGEAKPPGRGIEEDGSGLVGAATRTRGDSRGKKERDIHDATMLLQLCYFRLPPQVMPRARCVMCVMASFLSGSRAFACMPNVLEYVEGRTNGLTRLFVSPLPSVTKFILKWQEGAAAAAAILRLTRNSLLHVSTAIT